MQREQLADAVDYALTDNYADAAIYNRREKGRRSTYNLQISTTEAIHDQLHAAAKAAGTNLSAAAEKGLRAFVAGKFTPDQPPRAGYGTGKANINVRFDKDLRAEADKRCKELTEQLGRKVALTHVVKQYLWETFLPDGE